MAAPAPAVCFIRAPPLSATPPRRLVPAPSSPPPPLPPNPLKKTPKPSADYFGFCIIKNKIENAQYTNERTSIIQELLPAMKLVKYYGWERWFEAEVGGVIWGDLRLGRPCCGWGVFGHVFGGPCGRWHALNPPPAPPPTAAAQVTEARRREMRLLFRNALIKTINVTVRALARGARGSKKGLEPCAMRLRHAPPPHPTGAPTPRHRPSRPSRRRWCSACPPS
jgi:hypothetical protein